MNIWYSKLIASVWQGLCVVFRGVFNVGKGLNGPNAKHNPMLIKCTTASKN